MHYRTWFLLAIMGAATACDRPEPQRVPPSAQIQGLPAAGWHRGDVSSAQENSVAAAQAAFLSASPNIEVDIIDFFDAEGRRTGLLVHEAEMHRTTGTRGRFRNVTDLSAFRNRADTSLAPEPFATLTELFDFVQDMSGEGTKPLISLDLKTGGMGRNRDFGRWVGETVAAYGFEHHAFASSFDREIMHGFREGCPSCAAGGIVFRDHWGLRRLHPRYTSLDLSRLSRMTFFMGFPGKRPFAHDFVLIQDDILFDQPEVISFWRDERNVQFVGAFVYDKDRPYTEEEWEILSQVDWIELDPPQMEQYLARREPDIVVPGGDP